MTAQYRLGQGSRSIDKVIRDWSRAKTGKPSYICCRYHGGQAMIDEVDRRLKEWVGTALQGIEVSFGPPNREKAGRRIDLYLVELKDKPPLRSAKRPPLQLSLRYLVTAWADDPEEAHRLLGQLVFAAMENPEFEIDLCPAPATVWRSFGVPPQPSFVLAVSVQKERPQPKVALIRQPLIVNASLVTSFHGVVLGPGDIPLAGARVEIRGLHLATQTDYRGRFRFSTVPSEPSEKLLEIKAKGRELSVTAEENHPEDGDPLVIRFNLMEE